MVVARNHGLVDDIFCPRLRAEKRPVGAPRIRKECRPPKRFSLRQAAERLLIVGTAVVLLAVVISSAYGTVAHMVRSAALYDAQSAPRVSVIVKQGDTLWTFARAYGAQDGDVMDEVDAIAAANHLDASASLIPGQALQVPVRNAQLVARLTLHGRQLIASRVE